MATGYAEIAVALKIVTKLSQHSKMIIVTTHSSTTFNRKLYINAAS